MKFKVGDLLTLTDASKRFILSIKGETQIFKKIVKVVEVKGELLMIKVLSLKENDIQVYSSKFFRLATETEIKKFQIKEMF